MFLYSLIRANERINCYTGMMKELEKSLKACANRRRLEILKFLKKKGRASVGEISDAIRLSFKSTSRHLVILYAVDIVEKEQKSHQVYYWLSTNQVGVIRNIIGHLQ